MYVAQCAAATCSLQSGAACETARFTFLCWCRSPFFGGIYYSWLKNSFSTTVAILLQSSFNPPLRRAVSGAQRLGRGVYKLQGPAFLFNAIEDSKSETGKACKICTTLQRNTLCQNSENMVWTRKLLPQWRHDADSAWLEICSVRARWDLHRKEERGCRSSTRDLLHGRKVFCQSFGTTVTNFIIAEA